MNIKTLKSRADAIPDLGQGGRTARETLTLAATMAEPKTSFIDIAPYMGSTTGYLALGAQASKKDVEIHSIDLWNADESYVIKAKKYHGIILQDESDLQPIWNENIECFRTNKINIIGNKTDILKYNYVSDRKISIYVDDICNNKERHDYAINHFMKHFIPYHTVLFIMDYFFCLRDIKQLQYQRDWFTANPHVFFNMGRINDSMCCVFLYMGGKTIEIEGNYD